MARKELWASGGMVVGSCVALLLARPARSIPGQISRPPPDAHGEYIKYPSGGDSIRAYLVVPERREAPPGVIVIHEAFGLTDFVRTTVERLAYEEGYVAMAPDLLSRRGGTPASPDSARRLIATLNPDTILLDLEWGAAYLNTRTPNQIGVIGFGWGGGESFRFAAHTHSLAAFVVCYGPSPNLDEIPRIHIPGYGVYADRDVRINTADMALAVTNRHVPYKFKVYSDVGQGFIRTREVPAVADQAWGDIVRFFRLKLKSRAAPPAPPGS